VQYRLLALDADGTLLDPSGALRPAVRRAVRSVQDRGIRVVLCTGRRYRTARPLLEALGLDGPAVVQNGVIVKHGATGRTLRAAYLPADAYAGALRILRNCGPPAVYVDEPLESQIDLVSERPSEGGVAHHPFLLEYLRANREHTRWVDSLAIAPSQSIAMLSTMGEQDELGELRRTLTAEFGGRIRTNLITNAGYRGHILEVASQRSGKWLRLQEIAHSQGIEAAEIAAIGDDTNDTEMLESAGLGIAMANAPALVRAVADHVTASNDDDGAAQAIAQFLL
jgi:Cof subfamily protein (haloacid dehalogenase superfamily)